MKTVSNDLFELIKSLSRQEKRYFKLYAARHVIGEQNNYVLLFDAIDRQEAYDEGRIREQFSDKAFTRQLHVLKNYLYKLIMDSLRNFHDAGSEDQFFTLLRNAQLLFDRGLYRQSEKVFSKAKRMAADNERFLQLLEIYRWEHQIAHSRNDLAWLEDYVQRGIREEFALLDKYRNFLEFQALNDRVFIPYWKKGAVRRESEKEELEKLFDQPLFRNGDRAESFIARYFYHNARFSFHLFLEELPESYAHIRRLVQMFAQLEPGKIKGKLTRFYSSALINQYIVQQKLGLYDEIPQTLEQLRQAPAGSPEQKRRLLARGFNLEVDYYIHAGQFSAGAKKVKEQQAEIREYRDEASTQQRLSMYYNLAYLYFGARDYNSALDWINRLLHDPELKTREDIHCFGRLLNLVIHFELGNDQLLEYIVKSTQRFLSARQRLFKVESVMLKLMRRYQGWVSQAQIREGFRKLSAELEKLKRNEFERRAFEYFDFTAWMNSKVSGRSFEEEAGGDGLMC